MISFEASLARWIEAVQLAEAVRCGNEICKTRKFTAPFFAFVGDIFFRLIGEDLQFAVSNRSWRSHESECWKILHEVTIQYIETHPRTIVIPLIVGEDLLTLQEKGKLGVEHLFAAGFELSRTHKCIMPDGKLFSHGDPQLSNFVYGSGRCFLIDFETFHRSSISSDERHADDVMCILLDITARLPEENYLKFVEAFLKGYVPNTITERIQKILFHRHSILDVCRRNFVPYEKIFPRLEAIQYSMLSGNI